ncbi:unnamed protein product [Protopolystoma xenopodis]|uniref:Uncharacterized protein n=1 Tax=Protopolystoma xenopodis TaxID=117903 RepID=A0A448WHQ3_9PLAT|nr:unnamed protein product [Protopolystoma xenopodis]
MAALDCQPADVETEVTSNPARRARRNFVVTGSFVEDHGLTELSSELLERVGGAATREDYLYNDPKLAVIAGNGGADAWHEGGVSSANCAENGAYDLWTTAGLVRTVYADSMAAMIRVELSGRRLQVGLLCLFGEATKREHLASVPASSSRPEAKVMHVQDDLTCVLKRWYLR